MVLSYSIHVLILRKEVGSTEEGAAASFNSLVKLSTSNNGSYPQMDTAASQYSSRSESGWTLYFDELSASGHCFQGNGVEDDMDENRGRGTRISKADEDLSMVSDASSGPPHYSDSHEDEYYAENQFVSQSTMCSKSLTGKRRNKLKRYSKTEEPSYLDDTASSPVFIREKEADTFHFENVEDVVNLCHEPQAEPTHHQGNPSSQKHFGLCQAGVVGDNENDERANLCLDNWSGWKR